MSTANHTFYIDLPVRTVLLVLVSAALLVFLPFAFLFRPKIMPALEISLTSFVGLGVFAAYMVLVSTVSVRESGVVLYRINKLRWRDVTQVRSSTVLGLRYLMVSRTRGFAWWIPLYLKDVEGFYAALRSTAPAGNALQIFAASRMGGSPKA